ncbi:hypothetical protein HWV54_05265 [Bartonella alsatica]|uniref:Uncharacterized protein n=2 Tax=Bartonella alsatica TaxID=52764 RepID=J0PYS3_9HYPH|nr:hypothetical protein [Bartonella alsatica]EJF75379.1 hypothetical protein MEC_00855 [Bartonella alsatica IBS 382]QLC52273.1 hypothetical protein HWV54_05265 [Bartonella alsatica]
MMRYYFAICAIILSFTCVVKASESPVFQGEASVIVAPTVIGTNVFLDKNVDSLLKFDSLLTKVVIPAHPGSHSVFWSGLVSFFQQMKDVCTSLGSYIRFPVSAFS